MKTVKKKRRTVLLLHGHEGNLGGIVNFYKMLSALYRTSKYHIIHVRVGKIQRAKIFNIFVIRLLDLALNYINFVFLLYKIKPDLVHVNLSLDKRSVYRDFGYFIISSIATNRCRILLHIHGWQEVLADRFNEKTFFNALLHYMLRKASVIIVLANRFKTTLKAFSGGSEKIVVVPTAVKTSEFEGGVNKKADRKEGLQILFLSRICKDKGIYEAVEGVRLASQRNKNKPVRLIFAGDGEDKKKLERYVAEQSMVDYVEFIGYVRGHEKVQVFLKSDIFLLPSYHGEGCPVAVLEAMAAGLPIISSDVGALKEIIQDNVNGIIVKRHSVDEVGQALNILINNRELRTQMGNRNKEKAQNEFDVRTIFNKIEETYDRILSEPC